MFELITNANVFTPEPRGIRHVLVCAGKIAYIGEQLPQLGDELDVSITDLDGAMLIPGLIDAHTHLTGGGGEAGASTRVPPLALSQITHAGVTSVIGLLGTDDLTRTPQNLVSQVMGLREEGLSAWCYTGGYHVPVITLSGSIRSDIVNIEPVIGVGEVAISDHRSSQPTPEEILRIASEAHVAGLMTGKAGVVHFHLGDGDRGLSMIHDCLETSEIPPRVFNPTHINRNKPLFDQACELSRLGCNVDLTAFPPDSGGEGWSAEEAVELFIDQGYDSSKLTISSDGGGCLPHFGPQGELLKMGFASCSAMAESLKNLLDSQKPAEIILPLMTTNVARLLKLSHKGRIEQGMDADMVVLDQTNRIAHVMARGIWHLKDGQQLLSGMFEEN